jgi:hypothetical protein
MRVLGGLVVGMVGRCLVRCKGLSAVLVGAADRAVAAAGDALSLSLSLSLSLDTPSTYFNCLT